MDGLTFLSTAEDGTLADTHGLFYRDTRYLSAFDLAFADAGFVHVGSDVDRPAHRTMKYGQHTPRHNTIVDSARRNQTRLVLTREQAVRDGAGLYEKIELANHSSSSRSGTLTVTFDVDFADLFEVRGLDTGIDRTIRSHHEGNAVRYTYSFRDADGDDVRFSTTIGFSAAPERLVAGRADFPIAVEPQDSTALYVAVEPAIGSRDTEPSDASPGSFRRMRESTDSISTVFDSAGPVLRTGQRAYDRTFSQAADELRALAWHSEWGPVPIAGCPWFAAVFGRDSLLTAYQTLPVAPALARGTLRYLAAHQGETTDEVRDEEPGKMFHELRRGELARTGAIPHRPYYGSVDATPLWIVLLHEAFRWTGDRQLVEELWEPFERALDWIERARARVDDDPFVYYRPTDQSGLVHKSWRDTANSVQFADGDGVRSSIAGVEVQGYVYDALTRAAALVRAVDGDTGRADRYTREAETLRTRFNDEFWLPDGEYFGAAKTENGEIVDSLTSSVGHCLWSGIVDDERAPAVADRLRSEELFSGWGVRTISTVDAGYSPISYHTGSVWPHDTSLVALGLAEYGLFDAVETVSTGLLDASTRFARHSLPELFCGFDASVSPMAYPAACRPQAWAAGAPFALLRALFALDPGDGEGTPPRARRDPEAIAARAIDPVLDAWDSPARWLRGDAD